MSRFGALAALAAAALAATAGIAAGSPQSQAATPKKGGDLTIMAGSPVPNWDPAILPNTIPGVQADRFNAIYGNLVWTDSKGQVQPGLARSLKPDKRFIAWTLKLRPGLKFTSGKALDAAAVKANWGRVGAPGSGATAQLFASGISTRVVNPTTLVATLQKPDATFALRVAEQLAFVADPATLPAQIGTPYTNPVGAGPFKFDSMQSGVSETVVRNPGYFEKGKPYLDKITWRFVSDPAQRVATVASGDAQYMNGYTFQFSNELKTGFTPFKVPAGGLRMYMFNVRKNLVFHDVRLRKAVALATNGAEIDQALVQDPKSPGWRSIFAKSSPYYSTKLLEPKQNLAEAQKLVDQVTGGSRTISFEIVIAAVPELQRAGQVLQLQLNKLKGLNPQLKTVALADWRNTTFNLHNFDLTFYPGVYDLNGAEVQMTGLFDTAGANNFTGYDSRKMNGILASARAATSPARKKLYFSQVQQLFLSTLPVYVFGIDYRAFFHTTKLAGFTPMGSGALLMKELYYTS
jgi:peptide/nickel transport system substrate-binding protein